MMRKTVLALQRLVVQEGKMTDWTNTLPLFLDHLWDQLEQGAKDRFAAARFVSLATAGLSGGGNTRMVVLRGAKRHDAMLEVHTDAASQKAAELAHDPRATVLVWDAAAQLQIRLSVTATLHSGTDVKDRWSQVPDSARKVYGGTPAPGQPIATPNAHTMPQTAPARFVVLLCQVTSIDALWLGPARHHRAQFSNTDNWVGRWVAP